MKNVTGVIKLTEIVHHELDPDPYQPMRIQGFGSVSTDPKIRIRINMMRIHKTAFNTILQNRR